MPFWRTAIQPAPPDVDVNTCSVVDCMALGFTISFSFYIPGPPLDVEKLYVALDAVVRQKMPQAGARLVVRNGVHEFHIPKTFSETNKPFGFNTASYDGPFPHEKYNFPPVVPTEFASRPCTLPVDRTFFRLFRGQGAPFEPMEFLVPGTPALQVFVSTYTDCTLIGLTAPHTLFDIHGVAALCRAWVAALNGKLDSIVATPRRFAPFEEMAAAEVASGRREQAFDWGGLLFLSFFQRAVWIFWFIIRLLREGNETGRWMWIPKDWLAQQKDACMSELKEQESAEWIGSNDILAAVVFKAMHFARRDNTQISLHNIVNLRSLLPDTFAYPYLYNAVGYCTSTLVSASQLGSQSILETALLLRRALNIYTSDTAPLKAQLAWVTRTYNGNRPPVMPSPAGAEYALMTNWRSAKLGELDFGSARQVGSGAANPSFVFGSVQESANIPTRGATIAVCESDEGIWAISVLGETAWKRVRASGLFAFL